MRYEPTELHHPSGQSFGFAEHARRGSAALCLAAIGFLWWFLATSPSPGRIFGLYSIDVFVALLGVTYVLAWAFYFAITRQSTLSKIAKCTLSTGTLLILFGLFELPAVLGMVDYRLVISLPESVLLTRIKPWNDPRNQLDRELLHIRRPGQRIVGETTGDLVHWLGIPTDRRYHIDAQYDRQGFRNDHEIEHAPVVLIGDSFVEAVLVPQTALLSTRLKGLLQVEVANLGQSGYGPQQELVILRRYGLKLRPKIVLWFFFEGNDLIDLRRYEQLIRDWDEKIEKLHGFKERSFTKNTLLTLVGLTTPGSQTDANEAGRRSGQFLRSQSQEGRTLYFAYAGSPLSSEELASLEMAQRIFLNASELCANNEAKLLFVYVPTKFRVYRDFCQFPKDGYGQQWQPNDLPSRLASWCQSQGIVYLDLTAALKEAAARGELVYFPDDGHWNAKGHEVAAEVIASFLETNGWPETRSVPRLNHIENRNPLTDDPEFRCSSPVSGPLSSD